MPVATWGNFKGAEARECIAPSKLVGTGTFYSGAEEGNIERIGRRRFQRDSSPLDPSCRCHTCMNFSRAYFTCSGSVIPSG
ncbi:MAG: hypothetical protein ACK4WB_05980 [Desulfatiglandales bacterium]